MWGFQTLFPSAYHACTTKATRLPTEHVVVQVEACEHSIVQQGVCKRLTPRASTKDGTDNWWQRIQRTHLSNLRTKGDTALANSIACKVQVRESAIRPSQPTAIHT
eukprot:3268304-Amphidinium_carterae.1